MRSSNDSLTDAGRRNPPVVDAAADTDVAAPPKGGKQRSAGGVQSIERAFTILETLATGGGVMGLSALAAESGCPCRPSTGWCAPWSTWATCGRSRPGSTRSGRGSCYWPRVRRACSPASPGPHLAQLVDDLGRDANLASLDGDEIVYIAQVPSGTACGMFTRWPARPAALHRGGQGDHVAHAARQVRSCWPHGMPRTPSTHLDPDVVRRAPVARGATQGLRDGRRGAGIGVRCVAVAVRAPVRIWRSRCPGPVADDAGDGAAGGCRC